MIEGTQIFSEIISLFKELPLESPALQLCLQETVAITEPSVQYLQL